MNKKSLFGSFAVCVLLIGLVSSIFWAGYSSSYAASKKVVLQYYTWTDEKDYMEKVVAAFNRKNADVEVKLNMISNANDEYFKKLLIMLSGGANLDLYSINGINKLDLYASKNALVDLTKMLKNNKINLAPYGPSFLDTAAMENGKYYALPYRSSAYALFYNKDIFDKEKIAYPKQMTWDEYGKLALKLTKGEGPNKQWGGYYADWIRGPMIALQKGSSLLDDNLETTSEWLQFLNRLYNIDKSHISYKEMKAGQLDWIKSFESGKIAMLPNGEWTINMLKADIAAGKCKMNFDMAPLPLPDGVKTPITTGGVSAYIGINSTCKNVDAAFKFARFLCGPEGEAIIANCSVLPAYITSGTRNSFLKATGIKGSEYFFNVRTVSENPPVKKIDAVNRAYDEEKDLYLLEQQNIQTTIKNFTDKRKEALTE